MKRRFLTNICKRRWAHSCWNVCLLIYIAADEYLRGKNVCIRGRVDSPSIRGKRRVQIMPSSSLGRQLIERSLICPPPPPRIVRKGFSGNLNETLNWRSGKDQLNLSLDRFSLRSSLFLYYKM